MSFVTCAPEDYNFGTVCCIFCKKEMPINDPTYSISDSGAFVCYSCTRDIISKAVMKKLQENRGCE